MLSGFFQAHVGRAATVAELLAVIQTQTGFDAGPLATTYLESLGNPLNP